MSNDWKPTSLGEILTLDRRPVKLDPEKDYAEIGIYSYGRGIFHKRPRTGFEVGDKDLFLIKKGDFIFQITFAWEGAFALASEHEDDMYGSVRFPTFRVNEDICYPPFLVHYFKIDDGRNQLVKISPGSAGRNRVLNTKRLPEIMVPLPSLEEQRLIVERLETLSARITMALSLRKKAIVETNAVLRSAQNQLIGSEPNPSWVSLNHYVAEIRNGKSPDCEKRPAKPDEWGVLKVGAVSFGVYNENQNKALPLSLEINPAYEVKVGDFLMIRANTKELVGACAIVERTRPKLLLSDKTFRFIFRTDNVVDPRYLNHVLKSPALRTQIEQQASGTSSTMKNISKEKVMNLRMPCIPLDEQRRIVAYLDSVQARLASHKGMISLRELQSATGEELDALLPSVLDRAFKGEL